MNFLIHHYLEYHAQVAPDSDAVVCLDSTLSYKDLSLKSNQLANFLIENGIAKGDRVGIYMDKCIQLSVAIYGILKAGAAYVPLDPSAPISRLSNIIDDCDIKIVVSADSKRKRVKELSGAFGDSLVVFGVTPEPSNGFSCLSWQQLFDDYPSTYPNCRVIESDLSYVIYTSGSTGTPKGIMHTHHSCLAYSRWAAAEYQLDEKDRLGNHSPLHFDISIFDWFAGVVAGSCTVIIPDEYTKFPASYSQLIDDAKLTVLFTVPFALIQLSLRGALEERDLSSLRWIIFGGEPFPMKHLRELMAQLPWVVFDNMYGPAEVNGCTHFSLDKVSAEMQSIPIGPINQISQHLIVNSEDEIVGHSEQGELLVRTSSMMQGYWGRKDLNSNAFYIKNPNQKCGTSYQHRFYRTGDLVSEDVDGNIWFIGRKDRQVKVRGYRVELDEIEAALVSYPEIEEAAVFAIKTTDGTTQILASFTVRAQHEIVLKDINRYLKGKLPQYALPSSIQSRNDFPRTTSGKIDRNALTKEVSNDAG